MTKLQQNDLIETLKNKAKKSNQEQTPALDKQRQQELRKNFEQLFIHKNDSNQSSDD